MTGIGFLDALRLEHVVLLVAVDGNLVKFKYKLLCTKERTPNRNSGATSWEMGIHPGT